MVIWTGQFPPSSKADVARAVVEAQNVFRVDFPPSFLAIATAHPMARPEPNGVALPNGFTTGLSHLLHFEKTAGAEGFSNIVNRFFPVEGVLEKGVIPFAEDAGGDLFCFSYRDDYDAPPIVFWSVDTGALRVAASFDDFVTSLRA